MRYSYLMDVIFNKNDLEEKAYQEVYDKINTIKATIMYLEKLNKTGDKSEFRWFMMTDIINRHEKEQYLEETKVGRPKKKDGKVTGYNLSKDIIEYIETNAKLYGLSKSDVVEQMLNKTDLQSIIITHRKGGSWKVSAQKTKYKA